MAMNYVLVPSTGFLYFNHYIMDEENDCKFVLVPSTGFLYFNKQKNDKRNICDYVLVPSTGFLYFNVSFKKRQINTLVKFSSPPRGSYISILSPYTSPNTGLSSPICGANPQMRETSISNWIIPITKPDFKPIGAKLLYFLKFNSSHPHMIQLSLILCTLTDMRCQFKLQVFGMFMHNIIFSKCIFKHIIHNFYCITAKQWI